VSPRQIDLRYGINPDRGPGRAFATAGDLPVRVLNGEPSYVNLLDALNAWQLVRELHTLTALPAAASFKHVSPAGAAVSGSVEPLWAYGMRRAPTSPLAIAYVRARAADRLASFGDLAALSDDVDDETASVLAREVSDGVVAPGYAPGALDTLRKKREGRYLVLQIDPSYQAPSVERRDVFGVTLEQHRGTPLDESTLFVNVPTSRTEIPPGPRRDLLLALVTAKYAQSNSVVVAKDGQAVGVAAGQQSRVACVRLAMEKARTWYLRRHPRLGEMPMPADISRPERDNAIDALLRAERGGLLDRTEQEEWLRGLHDVAAASDGFFPFRDSIDVAAAAGVRFIAQPGGSARDAEVIAACDEHGIAMAMTGLRLFHH
jgi:phosphoribosylaminoimidazolecarboxamide formyltransferase/IMP cyclohydrolase/phosphoribosylaminoimidazolecarboxamide formyltransferase